LGEPGFTLYVSRGTLWRLQVHPFCGKGVVWFTLSRKGVVWGTLSRTRLDGSFPSGHRAIPQRKGVVSFTLSGAFTRERFRGQGEAVLDGVPTPTPDKADRNEVAGRPQALHDFLHAPDGQPGFFRDGVHGGADVVPLMVRMVGIGEQHEFVDGVQIQVPHQAHDFDAHGRTA
jgi:hypothetical protein